MSSLINPPTYDRSCNINLQLSKSEGFIDVEKKDLSSSQSIYSLRISNIQQIGFTGTEQHALEHDFRNLILACNLVIQRTCITDKYIQYPNYHLTREYEESRNMVQKIGNALCVNIVENIELHDKVSIVVGIAEAIEEKQLVEVFNKLQKVNRYGTPKPITTYHANLKNAIRHYEAAMSEFSRLFKFKNMFNALELLVNIDGKDRNGPKFDSEAIRLDPRNCVEVKKWRDFYNRIKHAHKDPSDIAAYEKGEEDLNKELESSRTVVQGILLSKLSSL